MCCATFMVLAGQSLLSGVKSPRDSLLFSFKFRKNFGAFGFGKHHHFQLVGVYVAIAEGQLAIFGIIFEVALLFLTIEFFIDEAEEEVGIGSDELGELFWIEMLENLVHAGRE
jgi:hypothetical protein